MSYPIIHFQQHPIELINKKHYKKVDNVFQPTSALNLEDFKYDITLLDLGYWPEDIQRDFTIQGSFSQAAYQAALLNKLASFSKNQIKEFLLYQLEAIERENRLAWLQALEKLVASRTETLIDLSSQVWANKLKHVPAAIEDTITFLEAKPATAATERLKMNLSVDELALLYRLFADTGLLKVPTPKTKLFRWMAQHLSSKGQAALSDGSIKNAFNNPGTGTVKSLQKKIIQLSEKLAQDF